MIWRCIFFLTVLLTAATGPLWIFVPAAFMYTVWYTGAEILMVTLLVDAYFGYGHTAIPWYTFLALIMLIVLRLLKPYISLYNR
jgi:hypothetical protein